MSFYVKKQEIVKKRNELTLTLEANFHLPKLHMILTQRRNITISTYVY